MTVIPQNYKGSSKRERVEDMFDRIAPKYDLLNKVLSVGIDKGWRKKMVAALKPLQPKHLLDIATGTADVAIACMQLQPDHITGVDISALMLAEGQKKINELGWANQVTLQQADSENLPFADNSFDAITVAFGVRNFQNLDKGLSEMFRVLKPNGKVVILEFSQPEKFPIKQFYHFYSKYVLPLIGQIVSKERAAYEYLPESVAAFPYGGDFVKIMNKNNFVNAKCVPLTFGIASIYVGSK
ncbi:MAG: bifunctional demethylmenaquinone methyltransferase/2-methoxy-6-polyprenyl-1,4-benzoquinol methylase UbiE [Bacteroidota bacterium]